MSAPTPHRTYDEAEQRALRDCFEDPPMERGPAQFACGSFWPDELERRADMFERHIPLLRLAAKALRREIANDSRCQS